MSSDHERIYRSLENRIVPHLKQQMDDPAAPFRVRARLIRLRQAAVNPELRLRPLETEDGIFATGGSGAHNIAELAGADRSEARRVGKGCVRTCTSRWSPDDEKKK